MKRFVVALQDISVVPGITVNKDDVGLYDSDTDSVFFVRLWQDIPLRPGDYAVFDVQQTGDIFPQKICNICHRLLPTTNFARNQNNIRHPVRRPSCQQCRRVLEGTNPTPSEKHGWEQTKPDRVPFECPICGKRTIAGVTSKVVLEHDHRTGAIRGWVCDSCNTGIGRFKDDPEILRRAIDYLD